VLHGSYGFWTPLLLISWRASQVQFFCLLQRANLIGSSLKKMKLWTLPKSEGSILKHKVNNFSPSAHLYWWKEDNICQSIWDKMRCYEEHIENLMWIWREHSGNTLRTRGKWKKSSSPLPPHPKNLKGKEQVHAWAFPLAAWNFCSQKSLSPFLAWANTPCKERPTYLPSYRLWHHCFFCDKFSYLGQVFFKMAKKEKKNKLFPLILKEKSKLCYIYTYPLPWLPPRIGILKQFFKHLAVYCYIFFGILVREATS